MRAKEPQARKTQEARITREAQRISVPRAASKTLKYSVSNQSGNAFRATRKTAGVETESFLVRFTFIGPSFSDPAQRATAILGQ
jgi:hypothetical protein